MSSPKKQSKRSQAKPKEDKRGNIAPKPPTWSVGIDNRNESTRRYGKLEPEGYTRHVHGNREGEFQSGGKPRAELPLEEGSPMKEARFRKDPDKRALPPDQFGGRTYDSLPGDRDIVGCVRKKPRGRAR